MLDHCLRELVMTPPDRSETNPHPEARSLTDRDLGQVGEFVEPTVEDVFWPVRDLPLFGFRPRLGDIAAACGIQSGE